MVVENIRCVCTADTHFGIDNVGPLNRWGLPARVDDFFEAFERIVDYAIEWPADVFIHAGDIFKGQNPPQRVLARFLQQLARIDGAGIPSVFVNGNHDGDTDAGRAGRLNILDTIDATFEHAYVFHRPAVGEIEARCGRLLSVIGVPWPRMRHFAVGDAPYDDLLAAGNRELRRTILRLGKQPSDEAPIVMVGHLSVAGADEASERWMTLGWNPILQLGELPTEPDVIVLGHYHRGARFDSGRPVFYCGSPARIDFGEEGQDKFFWTFELDPSRPPGQRCVALEPHPIDDRRFLTFTPRAGDEVLGDDGMKRLLAIATNEEVDVKDAIVRVRIKASSPEVAAAIHAPAVERFYLERGAWWIHSVSIDAPRATTAAGNGEDLSRLLPQDLLRRYVDRSEPDEQRRGVLLEKAATIMQEGEDR